MTDKTNGKLDQVKAFAELIKDLSLLECLSRLEQTEKAYAERGELCETIIMNDFAPFSFYFEREVDNKFRNNGGIIWHGKHDGYGSGSAPTFSVSIDKAKGWQIHT